MMLEKEKECSMIDLSDAGSMIVWEISIHNMEIISIVLKLCHGMTGVKEFLNSKDGRRKGIL